MEENEEMSRGGRRYWEKKKRLIREITGVIEPNGGSIKKSKSFCQKCEKELPINKLTFHHPGESRGARDGGFSLLLEVQKDLKQENDVEVLCWNCHHEEDPQLNLKGQGGLS